MTQCQVGREEESACVRAVHGRRGKGTEGGRPELMPRVVAFDLPEGSAAAALHDDADPPCDSLMPGLLREPVLYPR